MPDLLEHQDVFREVMQWIGEIDSLTDVIRSRIDRVRTENQDEHP